MPLLLVHLHVLDDDEAELLVRGDHDLVLLGAHAEELEVVLRETGSRQLKTRKHPLRQSVGAGSCFATHLGVEVANASPGHAHDRRNQFRVPLGDLRRNGLFQNLRRQSAGARPCVHPHSPGAAHSAPTDGSLVTFPSLLTTTSALMVTLLW